MQKENCRVKMTKAKNLPYDEKTVVRQMHFHAMIKQQSIGPGGCASRQHRNILYFYKVY